MHESTAASGGNYRTGKGMSLLFKAILLDMDTAEQYQHLLTLDIKE